MTVVVPAYAAGPHLRAVVAALRRQSTPVERIIVSHSGEGDPTSVLADLGVEVLHSDARLFAGAARNRGLELATTDWVAFIDEDVMVDERWHDALLTAIARDDADCIVGSVGCAVSGGYWGMSVWFVEFGSVHPYLAPRIDATGASANMTVRAASFLSVGGFPESWRRGQDALAQAVFRKAGYSTRFDPDIVVHHVNLPGLRRMLRHLYDTGRSSARIRREHPELPGGPALRWPVISITLWAARLAQVYKRVVTARHGPIGSLAWHTPGILLALLAWNAGFTAEALQRSGPAS